MHFVLNDNISEFKQYEIYGRNNIYDNLLQKVVEERLETSLA